MTGNHLQTHNSFNACHVQLHFIASVLAIWIVLGCRGMWCSTVKENNCDNWKIKHNVWVSACVYVCLCKHVRFQNREALCFSSFLSKGNGVILVGFLVFFYSKGMPLEECDNCHIYAGCQTTSNQSKRSSPTSSTKESSLVQQTQMDCVSNICYYKSHASLNKSIYYIILKQ
jgi:hypothetical protein